MVNKIYSPPQSDTHEALASQGSPKLAQHWTLLLLAPDHFFNENNLSFPIHSQTPQRVETMGHSFGRLQSVGAEMNLIAQGLGKISERWAGKCFGSGFFVPFFAQSCMAILVEAPYKAMRYLTGDLRQLICAGLGAYIMSPGIRKPMMRSIPGKRSLM